MLHNLKAWNRLRVNGSLLLLFAASLDTKLKVLFNEARNFY